MVKPYNYDFKKYKKETDYQAEINKALSEGDYYGAAVNEQFRNAKIELEGLSDKYQPTFKYMYCINPDGTKNQEEIAKFEAQNSKPQEPKVANTANVTNIAKVTATPNSANGKTLKTASQILETGDKADQIKLETSVNGSAKDNVTNNVAKNTTNSTSISWIYKTPSEDTYVDFTENIEPFLDAVENEISQREGVYTNKNEYNAMVTKRNEQLNLVVEKLDWYIDYFEGMNDGKDGSQEIMETVDVIRGYKEKAENLIYKMNNEKAEKDKYTTESQWLAYTDPVGALEKINSADLKNLTDEQKKEIEGLTKYLSQYNTERALVDALTLMGEGKTYEELEAERDKIFGQIGILRTGKEQHGGSMYSDLRIKGYENYLAYLDTMLGYYNEMKYMSYKTQDDYYTLGQPQIPKKLSDNEQQEMVIKNINNPYYYINNIFGAKEVYKETLIQERKSDSVQNGEISKEYGLYGVRNQDNESPKTVIIKDKNFERYDYMTEAEIRTYNYIYATEGEKSANKYLDYLTNMTIHYVDAQGNYAYYSNGINTRWAKNMKENANFLDKIEIGVQSGADEFVNIAKQLFSDEAIPESAYQQAYKYLHNDAGIMGKAILSLLHDGTRDLSKNTLVGLAGFLNPLIAAFAEATFDAAKVNYATMQSGATPIEASNAAIKESAISVATSGIASAVQTMLPKMSDEMLEIWNRNDNSLAELLTVIEGKAIDEVTENQIEAIIKNLFSKTTESDFEYNLYETEKEIKKFLNKDQGFQDNKYSQFNQYEQENLKLFEKSYNEKTITKQEYEEALRHLAGWTEKDKNEYLNYVKTLGII